MIRKIKGFFSGSPAAGPVEYIVAGLGNPGLEYENTRHNMGFLAVDFIAENQGFDLKRLRFKALCGDASVGNKRVLFLKPSLYMNRSGESVRDALRFYKLSPEKLIVISDDVALELGKMRIRRGGSDGGQKGLRNIIDLLGRDDFPRIRLGIGAKPHRDMELAAWVLSRFSKDENARLKLLWPQVQGAVELIIDGKIDVAMNQFN